MAPVAPGFIPIAGQSGQYMVETWQVVALAAGILVTVLTLYGALIRRNYDIASTLNQRLLGTEGDETDPGFLQQTTEKLDSLGQKMDHHHSEIEQSLRENQREVERMENQVERVEFKIDAVQRVVSDEHDVLFRGGSDAPETDGGQPLPENTRLLTDELDEEQRERLHHEDPQRSFSDDQ